MIGDLLIITGTIVCLEQASAERVLEAHRVSSNEALQVAEVEESCVYLQQHMGTIPVVPLKVVDVVNDVSFPKGVRHDMALIEAKSGDRTLWFFGPVEVFGGGEGV